MKSKFTILSIVMALAVVTVFSSDAEAYYQFSGSNNCVQCHTNFEGFGEPAHDFHVTTMGFSCNQCHGSPGDNPQIQKCAVCHDPNTIWNLHLTNAGPDQQDKTCATCHAVTGNEVLDWSDLKHTFK